jgi:hypothetical protein
MTATVGQSGQDQPGSMALRVRTGSADLSRTSRPPQKRGGKGTERSRSLQAQRHPTPGDTVMFFSASVQLRIAPQTPNYPANFYFTFYLSNEKYRHFNDGTHSNSLPSSPYSEWLPFCRSTFSAYSWSPILVSAFFSKRLKRSQAPSSI